MSWFKHNGNASFDSRMVALQEALGYFGIGVYWTMVERIECWGDGIYRSSPTHVQTRSKWPRS